MSRERPELLACDPWRAVRGHELEVEVEVDRIRSYPGHLRAAKSALCVKSRATLGARRRWLEHHWGGHGLAAVRACRVAHGRPPPRVLHGTGRPSGGPAGLASDMISSICRPLTCWSRAGGRGR